MLLDDKLPDTPKIEIPLLMLELIKLESPEIETLPNPQYPEGGSYCLSTC